MGGNKRKLVKVDGSLNSENYTSLLRANILLDYVDGDFFRNTLHLAAHHVRQKGFLLMKIRKNIILEYLVMTYYVEILIFMLEF